MKILLKNGTAFVDGKFVKTDVEVTDEKITKIDTNINDSNYDKIFDLKISTYYQALLMYTHILESLVLNIKKQ